MGIAGMNIAYLVTRSDGFGGACVHVRDLAIGMRGLGHRVIVLIGGDGPFVKALEECGIETASIRHLVRAINPVSDALALREILRELRRFGPDLICAHTAKAGVLGRVAGASLGVPVVVTAHGWSITGKVGAWQGRVYARIERAAAKYAVRIIDVCESERRLALANGIGSAEQHVVVHNGIRDIASEGSRDGGGRAIVRGPRANGFGIGPAMDPLIVMTARMERPKDHAGLLRALAKLKHREWRLDLIGEGPLEGSIRALAAELGLQGRVRFLGSVANPEFYLRGADIFILWSRFEGFPLTVLEAMRGGLPVVASDVGGISEAVQQGRTGLVISEADDLPRALDWLLRDRALRLEMGARGRARYEELFTFERMLERTVEVYEQVCCVQEEEELGAEEFEQASL
jgi:glycosyltransferase involved in cell wall biosynthesis